MKAKDLLKLLAVTVGGVLIGQFIWREVTGRLCDDGYDDDDSEYDVECEDDGVADLMESVSQESYDAGFADGIYKRYDGENLAALALQDAYDDLEAECYSGEDTVEETTVVQPSEGVSVEPRDQGQVSADGSGNTVADAAGANDSEKA